MSGFTSWRLVCHPGPEGSYSFAQVQSVPHHFDTQWYMDAQTETASQQLQHPGAVAILNQPLVNKSQVQTPVTARHRLQATEGLKLKPVDNLADRLAGSVHSVHQFQEACGVRLSKPSCDLTGEQPLLRAHKHLHESTQDGLTLD